MSLNVKILTPYGIKWSGMAEYLSFRTIEGGMGVLPKHAPLLVKLSVDLVEIRTSEGARLVFVIHGGYLLNTREGATIVADAVEKPEDIDIHRAEEKMSRAREILKIEKDARERARIDAKLQRHMLRIRVFKERVHGSGTK
ncbi:ATP synthase F1 subunit epsilon [Kosmotoga arenicorallina S304]|uniref:ATP synthase epsilon chain n=1 Tax=Kosmotoga arenicorallina S304 TaxID=1453497 RepID=A0A176JXL7_9BACT|nr:ATP synthase F1 subunit epsilon [Kosmotoga arenicorallina]OAA28469.1 ATP synthase F1 subunit epsilon [Kosmotoga arenicorallina S304]